MVITLYHWSLEELLHVPLELYLFNIFITEGRRKRKYLRLLVAINNIY